MSDNKKDNKQNDKETKDIPNLSDDDLKTIQRKTIVFSSDKVFRHLTVKIGESNFLLSQMKKSLDAVNDKEFSAKMSNAISYFEGLAETFVKGLSGIQNGLAKSVGMSKDDYELIDKLTDAISETISNEIVSSVKKEKTNDGRIKLTDEDCEKLDKALNEELDKALNKD